MRVKRTRLSKMEPKSFRFKGEKVKEKKLKDIWENLKNELVAEGYPVENIPMPKIIAVRMKRGRYDKIFKQLRNSPDTFLFFLEEYGEPMSMKDYASAVAFQWDSGEYKGNWFILICKGFKPLDYELKHEISHIWEYVLKLKWGSITRY